VCEGVEAPKHTPGFVAAHPDCAIEYQWHVKTLGTVRLLKCLFCKMLNTRCLLLIPLDGRLPTFRLCLYLVTNMCKPMSDTHVFMLRALPSISSSNDRCGYSPSSQISNGYRIENPSRKKYCSKGYPANDQKQVTNACHLQLSPTPSPALLHCALTTVRPQTWPSVKFNPQKSFFR